MGSKRRKKTEMEFAGSVRCPSLVLALGSTLLCGAQAGAQVLVDDFNDDHIDPDVWTVVLYGSGAQVAEVNQELEFSMPADSSGTEFGSRLVSRFLLRGDFDIQVDFSLLQWPDVQRRADGHRIDRQLL